MIPTLETLRASFLSGSLTPSEVIESILQTIKSSEFSKETFVRVTEDIARKQAKSAGHRYANGISLSLIDGMPLAWKDNINIAGIPTTAGLPELGTSNAIEDAAIYQKAVSSGSVCIGKTMMNELAFSGLGVSFRMESPLNPHDPLKQRISGGSSSGSAVAVARGFVAAGVGTDTGGSVRIPAAWNGLVGLKTTAGLLSTKGIVPLSHSLDSVGFLTRTVMDATILFEVLSGTAVPNARGCPVHRMELLDCSNIVRDGIESEIEDIYEDALSRLRRFGVDIKNKAFPEIEEVFEYSASEGNLISYEAHENWSNYVRSNPGVVPQQIEDRIMKRPDITEDMIAGINSRIAILRKEFLHRIGDALTVMMPTVAINPPRLKDLKQDSEAFATANSMALRNTRIANLLGLCSISIPIGSTRSGLPVGLMLHGAPFSEVSLIRLANAIEPIVVPTSKATEQVEDGLNSKAR